MAKIFKFGDEGRKKLLKGIKTLYDAVKVTLGPQGHTVIIDRGFGTPIISKDGVTVARDVFVKDYFEDMGTQIVKESATRTGDEAGDGTTTAVILTYEIFKRAYELLRRGANHVEVRKGMEKAVEDVVKLLQGLSRPVESTFDIEMIARVASNNDEFIAGLMKEAYDKVGRDGMYSFADSPTGKTYLQVVQGLEINRGWIAPHFITDPRLMKAEHAKPLVLVTNKTVAAVKEILPILNQIAQAGRPLIIVAEDVVGEALSTMIVNKMQGILPCCAVRLPGAGEKREAVMEDIAIVTGATIVASAIGKSFQNMTMADLGTCDKVVITKDTTTFIGGAGKKDLIDARISQLKADIERGIEVPFNEKRLGKLAGGVAVIYVGGNTDVEMAERKLRVEDAVCAVKAALTEGIIPGGGVAYLQAYVNLSRSMPSPSTSFHFDNGYKLVLESLLEPMRQIIRNAGKDVDKIMKELIRIHSSVWSDVCRSDRNKGFNAQSLEISNLVNDGIFDPTKVARIALENAVSIVNLMVISDCLMTNEERMTPGQGR